MPNAEERHWQGLQIAFKAASARGALESHVRLIEADLARALALHRKSDDLKALKKHISEINYGYVV